MLQNGLMMRIYIAESTKVQDKPGSRFLVDYFMQKGLTGCTVYRGMSGFGHEHKVRTVDVFQFSLDRRSRKGSGPDRERREKNRGIEDIVHRSIHSWFPVAVTPCLLHTGFRPWRRKRRCPENNW